MMISPWCEFAQCLPPWGAFGLLESQFLMMGHNPWWLDLCLRLCTNTVWWMVQVVWWSCDYGIRMNSSCTRPLSQHFCIMPSLEPNAKLCKIDQIYTSDLHILHPSRRPSVGTTKGWESWQVFDRECYGLHKWPWLYCAPRGGQGLAPFTLQWQRFGT